MTASKFLASVTSYNELFLLLEDKWSCNVVVARPLRTRKALGSAPRSISSVHGPGEVLSGSHIVPCACEACWLAPNIWSAQIMFRDEANTSLGALSSSRHRRGDP